MPQTLLALFAIIAASVLSFQNSQTRIRDITRSHRGEISVQARGAAISVLERLSGVDFDGGEGGDASSTGTDAYSPTQSFGSGSAATGRLMDALFADSAFDDLDDFDGVQGAVSRNSLYDPASDETRSIDLTVDIQVEYVEQDASDAWVAVTGSSDRTHHKRATVTIAHPTLTDSIRLGRIYAAP